MRRPARLAHRFIQHTGGLAIPTIVYNTADYHKIPGLRLDDWLMP
jgi:hypothetical protein